MQIDAGLDTGPMLLRYETEIGPDETAPELAARLAEAGAPLVAETLRRLERGEIAPSPQDDSQASFAPLLKKEDGRIDWSLSAQQIYNRIRGLQPWPGAFTTFRGKSCHIWGTPASRRSPRRGCRRSFADARGRATRRHAASTPLCELESVQLEGRKRVTAREFANGARLARRALRRLDWRRLRGTYMAISPPEKLPSTCCAAWRRRARTRATCCTRSLARAVKPADAALATELTLGVLRWRGCSISCSERSSEEAASSASIYP